MAQGHGVDVEATLEQVAIWEADTIDMESMCTYWSQDGYTLAEVQQLAERAHATLVAVDQLQQLCRRQGPGAQASLQRVLDNLPLLSPRLEGIMSCLDNMLAQAVHVDVNTPSNRGSSVQPEGSASSSDEEDGMGGIACERCSTMFTPMGDHAPIVFACGHSLCQGCYSDRSRGAAGEQAHKCYRCGRTQQHAPASNCSLVRAIQALAAMSLEQQEGRAALEEGRAALEKERRAVQQLQQRLSALEERPVEREPPPPPPPEEFECPICFENHPIDDVFQLDACQHQLCRTCATRHMQACFNNGRLPDCCIPRCDAKATEQDVGILSDDLRIRFLRLQLMQNQIQLGFICCTQCGEGIDVQELPDRYECPSCGREFCKSCQVPWHENSTCERYQEWLRDNMRGDVDAEALRQSERGLVSPCCRQYILKDFQRSCNSITCIRCKVFFCFLCGQQTGVVGDNSNGGHNHFGIEGTPCYGKMWEGCNIEDE